MSSPPKIDLLPEHLIDQIKAGEVIERPGSLIKEILENSIDAGSTRLELTIKNNGLELINLKDNGHGINSKDLALAFSRHATSKIRRFEDLYRLGSFGFRGEALASIASISKLQCISFNVDEAEGSEIRIEGGQTTYLGSRNKNSGQVGTELIIQDLFFNTPVRLKFIQSQQAEKNFLKKIIYSFVMAHPHVEFILKLEENEKEVFPSRADLKTRILDVFPKSKELILYTKRSYEENDFEIFLLPGSLKSPVKFQYTYINNRFVLDKQLHRVISNALLSQFGTDDFHYLAFAKLPTDHIDVNVHPNKTIIKLFETSKIISLISGSIKELAGTKRPQIPHPISPTQNSFSELNSQQSSLAQERQEYNMEGFFSPHNIPEREESTVVWIGNHFIYHLEGKWEAISGVKLLSHFIQEKLKTPSSNTIPLLVSEPFKIIPHPDLIKNLYFAGLEIEKLSTDTVVLRSIPEWMNGFPLKDIVASILKNDSLINIQINPKDWSQSTWEEMISFFGVQGLRSRKISLDLNSLLEEKI